MNATRVKSRAVIFTSAAFIHGQAAQTQTAHARETAVRSLAHTQHTRRHSNAHNTNTHLRTQAACGQARPCARPAQRTRSARPRSAGRGCFSHRDSLADLTTAAPNIHRAADPHPTKRKRAADDSQATGSPPKADAARPLVATLEVRVPDAIYTCAHARHQPSVEIGAQHGR